MSNLGHELARSKRNGFEPAPERSRQTTWQEFLTRHRELIEAADVFTVEVWTRRGLQRFTALFFIELSMRKVEIAGVASAANRLWMSPIDRNVTDADGIVVPIPEGCRTPFRDYRKVFASARNHCSLRSEYAEVALAHHNAIGVRHIPVDLAHPQEIGRAHV